MTAQPQPREPLHVSVGPPAYTQLRSDPHAARVCLTPPVDVALARSRVGGGSEEFIEYLDVGIRLGGDLVAEHRAVLSAGGWEMLDNGDLTVEAIRALLPRAAD